MQNLLQKKSGTPVAHPSPLAEEVAKTDAKPVPKEKEPELLISDQFAASNRQPTQKSGKTFQIKNYFLYLPLLLTSIILGTILIFIFQHVEPDTLKDILIPNSYAPVAVLLWSTTVSGFTYLFMSLRRGLFISLCISLIFIAQVEHFLSFFTLLIILIPFIVLEMSLTHSKSRR